VSIDLFTYGTLEIPEIMQAVTGRRFASEPGTVLEGYARFRVDGRRYPGIREAPGSRTEGRLYRGVDPDSLAALDRFEGDLYVRCALPVLCAAGSAVAETYVVRPGRRGELSDEPWDRERFLERDYADYLAGCRAFGRRAARLRRGT
jgi:gamma-glutamylcyclotransferase (GGCT)/AIG2-like uncharacterized protein YtfP